MGRKAKSQKMEKVRTKRAFRRTGKLPKGLPGPSTQKHLRSLQPD